MQMRPKATAKDLPPRMLRRSKRLKNGDVWSSYYYNGRDEDGARKEIPLGHDLNEAKRKWAELESKPAPVGTNLLKHIFDRYEREILHGKAPRTQKDNLEALRQLRPSFDSCPIAALTPQHMAQYRDKRSAKVRANREIALMSHVFNMAREWGYTAAENPCRGVRKNKEMPRGFYADAPIWDAVYKQACIELQDSMDLSYLTGQRPADVLKMMETDIRDGAIEVKPNKTRNSSGKKLRILLNREDGSRSELGELIDRIRARVRKVRSLFLIATPVGTPLNKGTLRLRFVKARGDAAALAEKSGTPEGIALAAQLRAFQFRDIRPKAASETDIDHAQKLLGHTKAQITETVYRRVGEAVKSTR